MDVIGGWIFEGWRKSRMRLSHQISNNKPQITTLLACVALFLCAAIASGADKVSIALNWVPEPEFGGIYAAQQTGAYQKRNLDVAIKPGGAGAPTWQQVAAGNVDFGVASADEVVNARANGADIVAIFAIYQTCPQGIMVH